MIEFRKADETADSDAIWSMLEPVFRAGETYTIDQDISRDASLQYWFSAKVVYLARLGDTPVGTFYILSLIHI